MKNPNNPKSKRTRIGEKAHKVIAMYKELHGANWVSEMNKNRMQLQMRAIDNGVVINAQQNML